jgi:hypothetical protein
MGAVWLRARAQLRGRVWASLLLLLLAGLAGGVVLAALAGARRSDAALPRFRLPVAPPRPRSGFSDQGVGSRRGPTSPRSYG